MTEILKAHPDFEKSEKSFTSESANLDLPSFILMRSNTWWQKNRRLWRDTGWRVPKLISKQGAAARTFWLIHEPPTRTPLSRKEGPLAGNPQWNDAIERFSPWLTTSGHDHESPLANKCWYCQVGQTVCVNVGQTNGLWPSLVGNQVTPT